MTIEKFDALLPYFFAQWEEYNSHYTLNGKPRQKICYTQVCSILPCIEIKLFLSCSFAKLIHCRSNMQLILALHSHRPTR